MRKKSQKSGAKIRHGNKYVEVPKTEKDEINDGLRECKRYESTLFGKVYLLLN